MKQKSKKGAASQILTITLLIIIVIIAILSISTILKNKQAEDIQTKFNCINDVKIEILNACYNQNILNIKIKNKEDIILGDFFLINMQFNDKTSETIPTPFNTFIESYETKIIQVPYHQNLNKIKVIPRIESQSYLCPGIAPEYENIMECEEN